MQVLNPTYTSIFIYIFAFTLNMLVGVLTTGAKVGESLVFALIVVVIYLISVYAIQRSVRKMGLSR
jgi:hypothetical protein